MAWQRLTVFGDAPDPEVLRAALTVPCRLFRSQSAGAYFLETSNKYNERRPSLGGYYDSMFRLEGPFDLEWLRAFESANSQHKTSFHIHDECVQEAIFASRLFQTVVLSSYSDDEADDFVAVARNGELTHVRFEGYREVVRTLSTAEAAHTVTEFQAVRVDPAGKVVQDAPTSEYQAYEARMSPHSELSWHPYWRYIEGELNAHLIFKSLSHDPADMPGNLMFRAAHLEFRNLFGVLIPDPDDKKDDYELVAEYVPPRLSGLRKARRTVIGFALVVITGTAKLLVFSIKRYWKYVLVLAALIGLNFFRSTLPPTEDDVKKFKFADHCGRLDGQIEIRAGYAGLTGRDQCRIGDLVYLEHELPGNAGEVRRIAGTLEKTRCEQGVEQACLFFNGVRFDAPLESADLAVGDIVLAVLRRTQLCDHRDSGVCDDGRSVFIYEAGVMFDAPTDK